MTRRRSPPFPSLVGLAAALLLLLAAARAPADDAPDRRGAGQRAPIAYLDANQNGVVTWDEFQRFRATLFFGPPESREHWDRASRFAFAACDVNGDGVLTVAELREHPECAF